MGSRCTFSKLHVLIDLCQGFLVNLEICEISSGSCVTETVIEGPESVRVGPHAYDHSYVQFYLGALNSNFSIE